MRRFNFYLRLTPLAPLELSATEHGGQGDLGLLAGLQFDSHDDGAGRAAYLPDPASAQLQAYGADLHRIAAISIFNIARRQALHLV